MSLAVANCCFSANVENMGKIVFGGKELKNYAFLKNVDFNQDFSLIRQTVAAKLSEYSLPDGIRKIYLAETFRFWKFTKNVEIPVLVSSPFNTTYRIEVGDKIYSDISEIVSDKSCQSLKDGKDHVFGKTEYTCDIPPLVDEYSAAYVLADQIGEIESIQANISIGEKLILPADLEAHGLINSSEF